MCTRVPGVLEVARARCAWWGRVARGDMLGMRTKSMMAGMALSSKSFSTNACGTAQKPPTHHWAGAARPSLQGPGKGAGRGAACGQGVCVCVSGGAEGAALAVSVTSGACRPCTATPAASVAATRAMVQKVWWWVGVRRWPPRRAPPKFWASPLGQSCNVAS